MHEQPPPQCYSRATHVLAGGVALLLLLGGCANPTKLSSVWNDKSQRNARFDKLLIVAVSDNTDRRLSFEDALVTELSRQGTSASASARLMSAEAPINEENLRAVVAQVQASAVLVTKLESVAVKPVEAGGRSDVLARQNETGIGLTPTPKPGTLFQYDYEEKIEPVYITAEYTAVVTTDVYSAVSSTNVYSVVSTTSGQESVPEVISVLSKAIADRLREDGVVR